MTNPRFLFKALTLFVVLAAFAKSSRIYSQEQRPLVAHRASRSGGEAFPSSGGVVVTAEKLSQLMRLPNRPRPRTAEEPCHDDLTPRCTHPAPILHQGSVSPTTSPPTQLQALDGDMSPLTHHSSEHMIAGSVEFLRTKALLFSSPPPPNCVDPRCGVPKVGLMPQPPVPGTSWKAVSISKGNPSDAQIAVSSTHVAVTFENTLAWYTKQGTKLGEITGTNLFLPLLQQIPGAGSNVCSSPMVLPCAQAQSDMRILFDNFRKRFWVLIGGGVYVPNMPPRGIFLIGVSMKEDPKAGWYMYWTDAVGHYGKPNDSVYQTGDIADYPSIGINAFGFHITNPVFNCWINGKSDCSQKRMYRYAHVVFFPGNPLATGTPASGWEFYDLTNPDGSTLGHIQPVMDHNTSDVTAYYASDYNNKLVIWRLNNPLTANQQLANTEVGVCPFNQTVDAPQLSTSGSADKIVMTNTGNDVMNAVLRGNYLYLTMNDARDWFNQCSDLTSVRLLRLSIADYPSIRTDAAIDRTFGASSTGDPAGAQMYYGWPAVEVNKNGDMVIVYARSGQTIYPEVRYSVYYNVEPDIRPSRLLKAGENTYGKTPTGNALRWADTAGASVDPQDDTSVWIAQQYANSSNAWDIWVGKVTPPKLSQGQKPKCPVAGFPALGSACDSEKVAACHFVKVIKHETKEYVCSNGHWVLSDE